MQDCRSELKKIFTQACAGLRTEKECSIANIFLVGELYRNGGCVSLNMSEHEYLKQLGLSKDQYHNRAMAARVMLRFPAYEVAFRTGTIGLSVLAAVASKITDANSDIILENVCGKSKREARCFLSKVTCDGTISNAEGSVEITLTLKESDLKKLEEARSVLSHGGTLPSNVKIFMQALEDLLSKRDPVRKAERAKAREEKKSAAPVARTSSPTVPAQPSTQAEQEVKISSRNETSIRAAIPMQIKHAVWLRDQRQCTHRYGDGSRCRETNMLEIDHVNMWCRGGEHSVENLRITCRQHNKHYAAQALGDEYMERYRN